MTQCPSTCRQNNDTSGLLTELKSSSQENQFSKGEIMKKLALTLLFAFGIQAQADSPIYLTTFNCSLDTKPTGAMEILSFEVFFDLDQMGEATVGSLMAANVATGAAAPDPTEIRIAVKSDFTVNSPTNYTSSVVLSSGDTIDVDIDFSAATSSTDGKATLRLGTEKASYTCSMTTQL